MELYVNIWRIFSSSGAIPSMSVAARSDLSGTEGLTHFTVAAARFSIFA